MRRKEQVSVAITQPIMIPYGSLRRLILFLLEWWQLSSVFVCVQSISAVLISVACHTSFIHEYHNALNNSTEMFLNSFFEWHRVREGGREKDNERQSSVSSASSFSRGPQQPGLDRTDIRRQGLHLVFHMGGGHPRSWAITCSLPETISRKLDRNQRIQDLN